LDDWVKADSGIWTIPSVGIPSSDAVSYTRLLSRSVFIFILFQQTGSNDNIVFFSDFPVIQQAISLQTVFQ